MKAFKLFFLLEVIRVLVGDVDGDARPPAVRYEQPANGTRAACSTWICPTESTSCVKIVAENGSGYTWLEANTICRQAGGRLPIIHDYAESVSVQSRGCLEEPSWLGLRHEAGTFLWQPTKVAPSYTNFKCEQNQQREEGCVIHSPTDWPWAWSKANCSEKNRVRQVVCQKWKKATKVELTERLSARVIDGFVSLTQGDKRGALCLRSWSYRGADVVCRQHIEENNHVGHVGSRTGDNYPNQTGFWFGEEFCNGRESHLAECVDVKWIAGSLSDHCPHSIASAECIYDCTPSNPGCFYDIQNSALPFNVTHNGTELLAHIGQTLTFGDGACQTGQRILGPRSIECLPGGVWSDTEPECEDIFCSNPGIPDNAERRDNDAFYNRTMRFNSTVQFLCYDGYKLAGLESQPDGWSRPLRCTENGTWSDLAPLCIPANFSGAATTCHRPDMDDQHLQLSGFSEEWPLHVGSKVTFSCIDGFSLTGSSMARCLPNGSLSDIPRCKNKATCVPPSQNELPPHVTVEQWGSELYYNCKSDYQVDLTVTSLETGFPVCDSTGKHLKPPTCL